MSPEFESVFARLRAILQPYAAKFSVSEDKADTYSLAGPVGPAALAAWGGKMKYPHMPVACVRVGKAYVSYHLMGLYTNTKLKATMSPRLKTRMQGKTCLNFKSVDEDLFAELQAITARAIKDFSAAGFTAASKAGTPASSRASRPPRTRR